MLYFHLKRVYKDFLGADIMFNDKMVLYEYIPTNRNYDFLSTSK
jgi:hypothetical protein